MPVSEKMRQTWATLAAGKRKTPFKNTLHYVTSPQSGKPRKWPPDTCGFAFEKLILRRGVSAASLGFHPGSFLSDRRESSRPKYCRSSPAKPAECPCHRQLGWGR